MKYQKVIIALLFCIYLAILPQLKHVMINRPFTVKLGYYPSVKLLKLVTGDQKLTTGAFLLFNVITYFGGALDKAQSQIDEPIDYQAMSVLIHNALALDPYNSDGYYFAQSILVWDVKKIEIANDLLDYGMRYRTWDWSLPYFAGFNYAYFMKDYSKAAVYYRRAAELSGNPLYIGLAGRYLQKSGQTELAIAYLTAMEKGERNPAVKKSYQLRLNAFRETRRIEIALERYREARGAMPTTVEQLVSGGFLSPSPRDPYGGQFYLEQDGNVATTSKFAFAGAKKENKQKAGESQ